MKIFIYRPDLGLPSRCKVDLELLYTLDGKPYLEWKREQDIVYDYKLQKAREKLEEKPDWKVFSY